MGLPTRLERSRRSTPVISSTDRIPRSMRPFDCVSATNAPTVFHETLEDSRFLSTHPRLLLPDQISRLPGHSVPIVPSLVRIAEPPSQELPPSVAPRAQKPCGWHEPSKPKSLLVPFRVGLAWSSSHNSLASCPCPLRLLFEIFDLCEQGCWLVQRHSVCTNFDKEDVSAHALAVPSIYPALSSFRWSALC